MFPLIFGQILERCFRNPSHNSFDCTEQVAWLDACVAQGKMVMTESFRPKLGPIFLGLKICSSQVPIGEKEKIVAAVEMLGGIYTHKFEPWITHLILLRPKGVCFDPQLDYSMPPCLRISIRLLWYLPKFLFLAHVAQMAKRL